MQLPSHWNTLKQLEQLETIWQLSNKKVVAIFKHSTRCGTSLHAFEKLARNWNFDAAQAELFYLDLLANREISNDIAIKSNVQHQSPQLIVLKEGKVVYYASHLAIDTNEVAKWL